MSEQQEQPTTNKAIGKIIEDSASHEEFKEVMAEAGLELAKLARFVASAPRKAGEMAKADFEMKAEVLLRGRQWLRRKRASDVLALAVGKLREYKGRLLKEPNQDFVLLAAESAGESWDKEIQEMWANLIASAFVDDSACHPGYIKVLQQLSVRDAKVLEFYAENRKQPSFYIGDPRMGDLLTRLFGNKEIGLAEISRIENLDRLGLVHYVFKKPHFFLSRYSRHENNDRHFMEVADTLNDYITNKEHGDRWERKITDFGNQFHLVCSGALLKPEGEASKP